MLRIIESFRNLPESLEPSKIITCQPGQIGALKISKGKTVVDICDGLHPFGIIDDIKTRNIRCVATPLVKDCIVRAEHYDFDPVVKKSVLTQEHTVELAHRNIIAESFVASANIGGHLKSGEGLYVLPKGTACNYRLMPTISGNEINDAVRFSCSYAYHVTMKREQNSIMGTGRITVWTKNLIADTDMFDTSMEYPKYANLYVNKGYLTTCRVHCQCPTIGIVLNAPQNSNDSMLRFLFDPNGNIDIAANNERIVV